jgi:hypothetical protein
MQRSPFDGSALEAMANEARLRLRSPAPAAVSEPGARRPPVNLASRYRAALESAVSGSAAPYGYTLTVWTTGAIVIHARGLPTTVDAVLFVAGAIGGFVVSGLVAFGGVRSRLTLRPNRAALWSAFHVGSVGVAVLAAGVVGHLLVHTAAWPLSGFVATVLYLCLYALQIVLAGGTGG